MHVTLQDESGSIGTYRWQRSSRPVIVHYLSLPIGSKCKSVQSWPLQLRSTALQRIYRSRTGGICRQPSGTPSESPKGISQSAAVIHRAHRDLLMLLCSFHSRVGPGRIIFSARQTISQSHSVRPARPRRKSESQARIAPRRHPEACGDFRTALPYRYVDQAGRSPAARTAARFQ